MCKRKYQEKRNCSNIFDKSQRVVCENEWVLFLVNDMGMTLIVLEMSLITFKCTVFKRA
jgi:hypothetical protein